MTNIVRINNDKGAVCRSILEELPEWFGIESARENYIRAVANQVVFAFISDNQPIGLIGLKIHNQFNIEICVMGVLPAWHRQGIGRQLVDRAKKHAQQHAIQFLTVKTLSNQSSDENYAKTRLFYKSCGFEPFEEFPDLWGKENPCLMMIKPIL